MGTFLTNGVPTSRPVETRPKSSLARPIELPPVKFRDKVCSVPTAGGAICAADSAAPRAHAVHVGQVPHQHHLLPLVHPPARLRAQGGGGRQQAATQGGARPAAEDAQVRKSTWLEYQISKIFSGSC